MTIENLPILKFNKLTQAQYDKAVADGNIDETAFYLTPDTIAEHMHTTAEVVGLDSKLSGKVDVEVLETLLEQIAQLEQQVAANAGADYIWDQSMNGKIRYRRWKSGFAEIWIHDYFAATASASMINEVTLPISNLNVHSCNISFGASGIDYTSNISDQVLYLTISGINDSIDTSIYITGIWS